MVKSGMNLQDSFLNQVRKDNTEIQVVLLDGTRLTGFVRGFDNFTVIMNARGQQHLIYKHAIAQIISRKPTHTEMPHEAAEAATGEAAEGGVAESVEAGVPAADGATSRPEERPQQDERPQQERRPHREEGQRRERDNRPPRDDSRREDRPRRDDRPHRNEGERRDDAHKDKFNALDFSGIKMEQEKKD